MRNECVLGLALHERVLIEHWTNWGRDVYYELGKVIEETLAELKAEEETENAG